MTRWGRRIGLFSNKRKQADRVIAQGAPSDEELAAQKAKLLGQDRVLVGVGGGAAAEQA